MIIRLLHAKRAAFLLLLATFTPQLSTWAQGTDFTYQGSLKDGGSPANGTNYGMVFYLYDAPTNGNQLATLSIGSVPVSNGAFSIDLDFGASFSAAACCLGITVQNNSRPFTTLPP